MKRLIYILPLMLLPVLTMAQDCLSPKCEYGNLYSNVYRAIVLDTLRPHSQIANFTYVVRPSFKPEYGLIYNKFNHTLVYSEVSSEQDNIWYAWTAGKTYQVTRWSLEIKSNTGDALQSLLRTAIATAVAPKKDPEIPCGGEDGTTYQFIANTYTAECWSPGGGNAAALVRLMDSVCKAVKEQNGEQIQSLLPEIRRLTAAFDKLVCTPKCPGCD